MNIKEKWQSLKNWQKVLVVLIALAILGAIVPSSEKKPEAIKPWAQMTSHEQNEWKKQLTDNVNHFEYSYDVEQAVKNQTRYPLETEVDMQAFTNPFNASTDVPRIKYTGTGQTKNGFGVKVAITWTAIVEYKPEGARIVNVQVY